MHIAMRGPYYEIINASVWTISPIGVDYEHSGWCLLVDLNDAGCRLLLTTRGSYQAGNDLYGNRRPFPP